jgi:hypothetical protein
LTKIKLKFVNVYMDRHGRTRRYFRRAGLPKIPLPGEPGSTEFMDAYQAAIDNEPVPPASMPIGAARTIPGSVSALIADSDGSRPGIPI